MYATWFNQTAEGHRPVNYPDMWGHDPRLKFLVAHMALIYQCTVYFWAFIEMYFLSFFCPPQTHCWLVSFQKAGQYPAAQPSAAPGGPAQPAEWEQKPKSSKKSCLTQTHFLLTKAWSHQFGILVSQFVEVCALSPWHSGCGSSL